MAKRKIARLLPVQVGDQERLTIGIDPSEMIAQREQVESEAKETAQRFKDDLTAMRTRINYLAKIVETGEEDREVECYWQYHDPFRGNKALYRSDTGELVESKEMVEADYQLIADEQQTKLELV